MLSQNEYRAISDEHLLGQGFAIVRLLNTPGAIPEVLRSASQGSGCSGSPVTPCCLLPTVRRLQAPEILSGSIYPGGL